MQQYADIYSLSDVEENKCLHTVASSWTFINIESWFTEPCVKKNVELYLNDDQ